MFYNVFSYRTRSFHVYQHVMPFSHMRGALVGRRSTAASFHMQNVQRLSQHIGVLVEVVF